MSDSWHRVLSKLLEPGVAIPGLLGIALLVLVFSLADVPKVVEYIRRLSLASLAVIFVLTLTYLGLKWIQFHLYLKKIPLRVTWRQSILAFLVGEMTLAVPAGMYAENYVLRRIAGADFSRSSAATTAILITEAGFSILAVGIIGIPGWEWLRPAAAGLLVGFVAVGMGLILSPPLRELGEVVLTFGPMRQVGPELIETSESLRDLFVPRIAVRAFLLCACYLLALAASFYEVARGMGIAGLNFVQATSIYLFSIAVVEVLPISSHLGVIEAGGVSAAQAWGYSWTEGLAMMLGVRLTWTGATWLVGLITMALLRGEFRRPDEDS